jgi:hypothetical protein
MICLEVECHLAKGRVQGDCFLYINDIQGFIQKQEKNIILNYKSP